MNATELAQLADHYWTTRQKRLDADKVAKDLKDEESRAEATLIKEMREQQLTAIGGRLVRLTIPTTPEYVPAVKDWDALYKHVQQTGDFSLLHKRVGTSACKERWDASEEVPGIERYAVYKLSKSGV
jgi:hypothetical protein